jgi:glucuronate isomerase
MIDTDRFFSPEPVRKAAALEIYTLIKNLPILSPHGHIDPGLFSRENVRFGNPVEVLIQPDHYILRMLVSQGISFDFLLNKDRPREVWQLFADHFYLYRGTPSGHWFNATLENIFNITEKLGPASAQSIYDQIESVFSQPEFTPRNLFEKMGIAVLATTDLATSTLAEHQAINASGWGGRVIPTFRADSVIDLRAPNWMDNITRLSATSGVTIGNFHTFITALEQRRSFFKSPAATATDTSVYQPATASLATLEVEAIFQRALKGQATIEDAASFSAHMLMEMARMSVEDGLVMQLHPGVFRNHNPEVFIRYGADKGFDIPVRAELTHNLKALLDRFGNLNQFTLILFTLDETLYSRELAPLAGAYPALRLGPPWWFHDSWNGMSRYFENVIETAGLYNTVGFCDDVRSFLAIPARHDLWRRASADWLAGLLVRHLIDRQDAEEMAVELAVGLPGRAYHLDKAALDKTTIH